MRTRISGYRFSLISYIKPLIVLTFLFPFFARGQEYKGISAYAMLSRKFPCHEFQSHIRRIKRPAISVLYGTFGTNPSCLARTLHLLRNRPHLLEIHMSNESGRRMRRLFEGEFEPKLSVASYNRRLEAHPDGDGLMLSIFSRLFAIQSLIHKVANPNTFVVVSTGLEDNFTFQAWATVRVFFREAFEGWKNFQVIRSSMLPLSVKPYASDDLVEIHASKLKTPESNAPFTVVNPDGINLDERGYTKLLRQCSKCKAVFYWSGALQGRSGNNFTPPHTRHFVFTMKDRRILKALFN